MILDRELLEDPMYLSERFTRMQALIDLCFLAASKPRTIFIRGNKVEIGKGQVWLDVGNGVGIQSGSFFLNLKRVELLNNRKVV